MSPRFRLELKIEPFFAPRFNSIDGLVLLLAPIAYVPWGFGATIAIAAAGTALSVLGKRYFGYRP